MNRRKEPILIWTATLLFTGIALVITFRQNPIPLRGTGDTGFFEIPNITEAGFRAHYPEDKCPGTTWVANAEAPEPVGN